MMFVHREKCTVRRVSLHNKKETLRHFLSKMKEQQLSAGGFCGMPRKWSLPAQTGATAAAFIYFGPDKEKYTSETVTVGHLLSIKMDRQKMTSLLLTNYFLV